MKLNRSRARENVPKETTVLVCPVCGSDEIDFELGLLTGQYKCLRCHYFGAFVLKRDVVVGEDGSVKDR